MLGLILTGEDENPEVDAPRPVSGRVWCGGFMVNCQPLDDRPSARG
jgi:hypothetical protein